MNIDCNVDISSLRCIQYLMHLPSNIETRQRQRGRKQRSTHKTFEQKPKCNSTLIRIKVTFQFPTNKSIIICRACVSFFVCVVFADFFSLSVTALRCNNCFNFLFVFEFDCWEIPLHASSIVV